MPTGLMIQNRRSKSLVFRWRCLRGTCAPVIANEETRMGRKRKALEIAESERLPKRRREGDEQALEDAAARLTLSSTSSVEVTLPRTSSPALVTSTSRKVPRPEPEAITPRQLELPTPQRRSTDSLDTRLLSEDGFVKQETPYSAGLSEDTSPEVIYMDTEANVQSPTPQSHPVSESNDKRAGRNLSSVPLPPEDDLASRKSRQLLFWTLFRALIPSFCLCGLLYIWAFALHTDGQSARECWKLMQNYHRLQDELINMRLQAQRRVHGTNTSQRETNTTDKLLANATLALQEATDQLRLCDQQKDELALSIHLKQDELEDLELEHQVLVHKTGVMSHDLTEATQAINELSAQLSNATASNNMLRNKIDGCAATGKELLKLQEEMSACSKERATKTHLAEENKDLVAKLATAQVEARDSVIALEQAQQINQEKEDANELLANHLKIATEDLEHATRTLSILQENIASATKDGSETRVRLDLVGKDLANAQRDLDEARQELSQAESERDEWQEKAAKNDQCPDHIVQRHQDHEKLEWKQNTRRLEGLVESLRASLQETTQQAEDEHRHRQTVEDELAYLHQHVTRGQSQHKEHVGLLEDSLHSVHEEVFSLSLKGNEFQHEIFELHRMIQDQSAELVSLRETINDKDTEVQKGKTAMKIMALALQKSNRKSTRLETVLGLQKQRTVEVVNALVSATIQYEQDAATRAINFVSDVATRMNSCNSEN